MHGSLEALRENAYYVTAGHLRSVGKSFHASYIASAINYGVTIAGQQHAKPVCVCGVFFIVALCGAKIYSKLDGILTELGFLVADEIAEDTAELIGDSLDFGSSIGNELTKKFPLSIPWDIALIIDCLSSPPATPVFELPLSIPSYGIDETITVDLSDFQLLSDVARWFFDVLFGLAITKLTMKILEIDLVHT